LVVEFRLEKINNFGDMEYIPSFWLEIAYFRPFLGEGRGWRNISSKWRHPSSYPQKAPPCMSFES